MLGVAACVLIGGGVLILRTTPADESAKATRWRRVLVGLACVTTGGLAGAYALGLIGESG